VAALLKQRFGLAVQLEEGGRGEFTVWLGEERVAKKGLLGFPEDERVVAAVERRLERG
jgi:hypothetical protein